MGGIAAAFEALGKVLGDDGRPMVDVKGVDARDCKAWRELLDRMDEEFVVRSRTKARRAIVRQRDRNLDVQLDADGRSPSRWKSRLIRLRIWAQR